MFPFGRRVGGTQAPYGEQRTKAQTLAEHRSALLELKRDLHESSCAHIPNIATRKTHFGAATPFESCSSILIRDLVVGSTHRRRVLKGRTVTEAIKMQSVQTVLEDEAGDVVTVSGQPQGTFLVGPRQGAGSHLGCTDELAIGCSLHLRRPRCGSCGAAVNL